MEHRDIVIIGGGPAGLTAGVRAAARGRRTLLLEKNNTPGAKILIAGGGRCNLTHACDARGIIDELGPQGKFLHSALAACGPNDVVEFFRTEGVPTYVEPETGKIFPQSNRSYDVLAVLLRKLNAAGCELATSEPLVDVEYNSDIGFRLTTTKRTLFTEKLLLATGGKSYPDCGTTGDGYRFAEKLGHTIIPPRPALVPISTHVEAIRALQGITLAEVLVRVLEGQVSNSSIPTQNSTRQVENLPHEKCLGTRRGALLFAHFGVTGPVVMDLSRIVSGHPNPSALLLECDLLPDRKENSLEALIAHECSTGGRKTASNLLDPWLPHRVGELILEAAAVPLDRRLAELTKEDRRRIAHEIKHFAIPVEGTLGFRKAEVTAGGVALSEVDSRTMQSKKCSNLYFSGELLDLDGPIGGYNLQIAFSTGSLAGESM